MVERRRKLQQTTMAELHDDLILEIVKRLPLKYAVQCSVLNKNIRGRIFEPDFLPSYSTIFHSHHYGGRIFTNILQEIRSSNSTTVDRLRRSVTLDVDVSIIISCNGLLLLRFQNPYSYYIFNPTTSAVMPVDHDVIGSSTAVGLAVPDDSRFKVGNSGGIFDHSGFKLVTAAEEVSVSAHKTRLKIRVIVPSLTDSGELTSVKSRVFDFDRNFKLSRAKAVYAHGSLYWLGDGGGVMVAFDVEKEEARLIDGPVESGGVRRWHGFVDGSFHLAYSKSLDLVVCRLDHCSGEWGVKHRISNICKPNPRPKLPTTRGELRLFDGRRQLFTLKRRGEEDKVVVYDVENGVWEMIGREADGELRFCLYTSTLVKVSDTYLATPLWKYGEGIRRDLLKLQEVLRPTNEIFSA